MENLLQSTSISSPIIEIAIVSSIFREKIAFLYNRDVLFYLQNSSLTFVIITKIHVYGKKNTIFTYKCTNFCLHTNF